MIFANIKNPSSASPVEKGVQEVLDYVNSHDLAAMEKGSHEIDGDRLFVNIIEYETTSPENRFWEAHKDYLDVHVPISGTEQIDLNFIENMDLKDYQKEGDFLPMDGDKNASVIMEPGSYLVCYPQDGHRTAVAAGGKPCAVKKAVFKVRIDQ